MKINTKKECLAKTHEGGKACSITPTQEMSRAVMACMLWEDTFYESGKSIADRIIELAKKVPEKDAIDIMYKAKLKHRLRHVPLLVCRELLRRNAIKARDVANMVQRADDLAELLSLYWKDGKRPLSGQLKKGLAEAFLKFDRYALSKYNRDNKITLRDVMFLCHPKPASAEQEALFKDLANKTLGSADTWETRMSTGEKKKSSTDKRKIFTDMLQEGKMGYLALLRNVRNMDEAGVDKDLIKLALISCKGQDKIQPFRFLQSAAMNPQYEEAIEKAFLERLKSHPKFLGKTIILIDCSGSMYQQMSSKSTLEYIDAACSMAMITREISEDCMVYAFHNQLFHLPPRHGMALRDAIKSVGMGGTYLGGAIREVTKNKYDRLIVITDEQAHDTVPTLTSGLNYMINVAPNKNGVGYAQKGFQIHIDGWSDAIVKYLQEYEQEFIFKD